MGDSGRLVYSTDAGRTCPRCRRAAAACTCAPSRGGASQGPVRVLLDAKRRRGKVVTVIQGVVLQPDALTKLAKALKRCCGSGGTVKDGTIEIQGDHRDRIASELEQRGYRVRR